jgi:enediyne biosynthesis protein E4
MLESTTGIHFANFLPEVRFKTNQILLNGSGVAAGDVDGDGKCDLYFTRLHGTNALYRNLGNWRFEDITAAAGVGCARLDCTGSALADLDGDGDLDLVVNSIANGTHVFINDGKAHFTELTARAPLNPRRGGMSMALGDIDGDGFLDLYVANYRTLALMDIPNARFWLVKSNGQQVISTFMGRSVSEPDLVDRFMVTPRGSIEELGEPDMLYRNLGGTNFVHVPFTNGFFLDEDGKALPKPPLDWGLAVAMRDINQDGLPDIYVCNDFDTPDRIWINQGGGKFRAIAPLALRKLSLFSMGVDFADINRDGFDDIFVVDMMSREHVRRMNFLPDRKPPVPFVGELDNRPQYSRNTLFLNRGDGTYSEMASLAGLHAAEWAWCPVFLDVDLDGWEDVLVTNGHERDARNMDKLEMIKMQRAAGGLKTAEETFESRRIFPRSVTANVAFRNKRDLTFEDAGRQWHFDNVGVSHGMALADLDDDGDLDVVINNLNAAPSVLRNESSAPRVVVRLRGLAPNTAGIGAKIKVLGGPVAQQQEMICGGRYLSSDQALRVFAAGSATNVLTIEVEWRSGRRSVVTNVPANSLCEIAESGASSPSPLNGERD